MDIIVSGNESLGLFGLGVGCDCGCIQINCPTFQLNCPILQVGCNNECS